jgi:sulfatase maturation enzyme AslB (radical SAM superfamily)
MEQDILTSYDYHDIVSLTIMGGEPLYNKTVSAFLNKLKNLGLSSRTRLEFHTNGTKINKQLFSRNTWNYVCVFLSLDAVGKKAEWLRYGCRWHEIESNIEFFKSVSNYIEVHCTLSILNINDLPALNSFCQLVDLPLKIMTLSNPYFMSILNWNGDKNKITDRDRLEQHGFEYYYDLIGTTPMGDCVEQLDEYISQFDPIRTPLLEYDTRLFDAIRSH